MKIAVIADIHANLQAWGAVRADIITQKVDRIVCLGDIIGYGPRPADVLTSVHANAHSFVLGNHDAVVAGLMDEEMFNEDARAMIRDTRDRLGDKAVEFFKKIPYILLEDIEEIRVLFVHGALPAPEEFGYIETEEEARATWDACDAGLVFVGHTHIPRIDVLTPDNRHGAPPPQDFILEKDHRYIVNVGSVGMPRMDDFRARYCIYDTSNKRISWHQTAYDIEAFQNDVREFGGASIAMQELLQTINGVVGPVREEVDFGRTVRLGDFSVAAEKPATDPIEEQPEAPSSAPIAIPDLMGLPREQPSSKAQKPRVLTDTEVRTREEARRAAQDAAILKTSSASGLLSSTHTKSLRSSSRTGASSQGIPVRATVRRHGTQRPPVRSASRPSANRPASQRYARDAEAGGERRGDSASRAPTKSKAPLIAMVVILGLGALIGIIAAVGGGGGQRKTPRNNATQTRPPREAGVVFSDTFSALNRQTWTVKSGSPVIQDGQLVLRAKAVPILVQYAGTLPSGPYKAIAQFTTPRGAHDGALAIRLSLPRGGSLRAVVRAADRKGDSLYELRYNARPNGQTEVLGKKWLPRQPNRSLVLGVDPRTGKCFGAMGSGGSAQAFAQGQVDSSALSGGELELVAVGISTSIDSFKIRVD